MRRATAASTVRDALAAATDAIAAAGSESPRLDAELLLAEATGWERTRLATEPEAELPPPAARRLGATVRRRVRREPVAYILGRKGFRGIELEVDPRVLIPRPETELLVEVAAELAGASGGGGLRVLDVGTGSGAVALAIADELSDAEVTGTDASAAALEVARANAERLGLAGRVGFVEGTLPDRMDSELLLANLPYVSESEWKALAPEIREFEPRAALIAGPGGLEAIESLLAAIAEREERPETIALEIGLGQAGAVAGLLGAAGYRSVETRVDLAGIERVVLGRRND